MTDAVKIPAIAVVFVNDRFLTSHAYLKDSAVCVRACHLAATGKDPRGPVFSALRQAKLGAEDVQLVEVQGTVSSPSQGQDLLSNGDFKEDVISAPELAPLVGFGTTSLTGLCEIGKQTSQNASLRYLTDKLCQYSLATSRLGSRVEAQPSQFFAVHFDSKRVDCGGNFQPLGRSTSPGVRRREKLARWSRKTWAQSCRRGQRNRMEDGRREVQGGRQDSIRRGPRTSACISERRSCSFSQVVNELGMMMLLTRDM